MVATSALFNGRRWGLIGPEEFVCRNFVYVHMGPSDVELPDVRRKVCGSMVSVAIHAK